MRGHIRLRFVIISLVPIVAVLLLMLWARLAPRPTNLGVRTGRLTPCPETPNCVCSSDEDPQHAIDAFPLRGTPVDSLRRIERVVKRYPGASIIESQEGYLYAEFRSRLIGYVDDVEFYAPGDAADVSCRSASRIGRSDLEANRKRIEALRELYLALPEE